MTARDATRLGDTPDNSRDPASDESKRPVGYPNCLVKTDRNDPKCLVAQEGAPRLAGRVAPPWHVAGHCGLRDIESKFQQFAMDPWCAR